ncbi:hypothetical protein VP01_4578g1 [Puccinia sorghi]|uniref:Uncharacterized protein n=1 Tax=Puccinia sorghi TaxID=27349 RepID=A0A0L6UQM7_9BASI|nr:hypothetical protein VP01_4578g1 [Puccinia sorghi]
MAEEVLMEQRLACIYGLWIASKLEFDHSLQVILVRHGLGSLLSWLSWKFGLFLKDMMQADGLGAGTTGTKGGDTRSDCVNSTTYEVFDGCQTDQKNQLKILLSNQSIMKIDLLCRFHICIDLRTDKAPSKSKGQVLTTILYGIFVMGEQHFRNINVFCCSKELILILISWWLPGRITGAMINHHYQRVMTKKMGGRVTGKWKKTSYSLETMKGGLDIGQGTCIGKSHENFPIQDVLMALSSKCRQFVKGDFFVRYIYCVNQKERKKGWLEKVTNLSRSDCGSISIKQKPLHFKITVAHPADHHYTAISLIRQFSRKNNNGTLTCQLSEHAAHTLIPMNVGNSKIVEISTLSFIFLACFPFLDLTGIIAIKKKSVVCFLLSQFCSHELSTSI